MFSLHLRSTTATSTSASDNAYLSCVVCSDQLILSSYINAECPQGDTADRRGRLAVDWGHPNRHLEVTQRMQWRNKGDKGRELGPHVRDLWRRGDLNRIPGSDTNSVQETNNLKAVCLSSCGHTRLDRRADLLLPLNHSGVGSGRVIQATAVGVSGTCAPPYDVRDQITTAFDFSGTFISTTAAMWLSGPWPRKQTAERKLSMKVGTSSSPVFRTRVNTLGRLFTGNRL